MGHPRLNITQEQLEHLLNLGFSGPSIAEIIGVSPVRRRVCEYGLSIRTLYSVITDQELDRLVSEIKKLWLPINERSLITSRASSETSMYQRITT